MGDLLCARRVMGITLLLVSSVALVGCREDKHSLVEQKRDAGEQAPTAPIAPTAPEDAGLPLVPVRVSVDMGASSAEADAGAAPASGAMPVPASPPAPVNRAAIASGDAVFFVGNSFFASWDRVLPDWVTAIGKAVSPPIDIKTGSHIVPGNQKLSWFLKQADSQNALKSKKYKLFVIQPEEREPVDDTANFKQAVRDWNKAILASGAKTMLFMTWDLSAEKGSTFFKKLSTAFDEIGAELDIPVIPVGLIYDDCNKAPFPGQQAGSYWLTGGELHQTETGSAVNAYATFGMLTGVNPMGIAINAPNNTNSPAMLKYLSDMSWTRVSARLKQ